MFSVLALSVRASAQTTTVTGTVKDANGNPYAGGTISGFISSLAGRPVPAGVPASGSTGPFTIPSTGVFSISVPSPFTWLFTVCGTPPSLGPRGNPTPTQVCFPIPPIAISGGSQDITTQINAALPPALGPASSGTISSCIDNGMYVAGSACYPTIQNAVDAAGTSGSVLIPGNFPLESTPNINNYTNVNARSITDLRGNDNVTYIWSGISPSRPASGFPLGNDLVLGTDGPADIYLKIRDFQLTSTTSCTGGLLCTATVGSPTLANIAVTGIYATPTALLDTSAGSKTCILEPGTANQEVIANYTIVSGTQISFTPVNSHTQPFFIKQQGIVFLQGHAMRPVADPTGQYKFFQFMDSNGNVSYQVPLQNGAFPLNAPQFTAVWTGGVPLTGAHANISFRNNTSADQLIVLNAANTAQLLNLQETGGGALFKLANATNNPITLNASNTAAGLIEGGGTGSALRLFGVNTGTGTSGTIDFMNNQTDSNLKVRVQGGSGHILSVGTALSAGNLSGCGTSPNLVGTDNGGTITVGSAAGTSCVLTFATAWGTAPSCVVSDDSAIVSIQPVSTTTTLTLTGSAALTGAVLTYFCTSIS